MQVGLTGGIGSGKSEVARIFASLGALIVDTDLLAREAVAPQSEGWFAIAQAWPQVVHGGALDRDALAQIVFSDPAALERLNAIVHPRVRRLAAERAGHAKPGQIVIHVVPLLFETGYADIVEKTVLVVAPENERIARVIARDNIDKAHILSRMAAQGAVAAAREIADYLIENDGDLAHLERRTRDVYAALSSS